LEACTCAAGKDVNTMHNENSVFPRRKVNTDRLQAGRKIVAGSFRIYFDDKETERGVFSKTSITTVTMTSRSITISNDHLTQRNKNDAQLTIDAPESKFFSNFLFFLILMFNLTPTLDQNV